MFLLYHSCLQNFKKIKNQLLCHQIIVKISSFYYLKLCIKNKFINRIVNNIWFKRNLICMLKTQGTWNSTVGLIMCVYTHTLIKIMLKLEFWQ